MVDDEVDGHLVLPSPGDDDVRVGHRGRYVVVEGRLDVPLVLLQHALDVPAALADVAVQAAAQTDVRVRVNEYLKFENRKLRE